MEKVEEYRSTEDAMRMALLTAQRLGDDITAEARRKSEELLSQTEKDIRDRLLEMKNKFADEDARLKSLKDETRKFVAASQEIIRQHSMFLVRIEELNREQASEPGSAPEPEEPAIPAVAQTGRRRSGLEAGCRTGRRKTRSPTRPDRSTTRFSKYRCRSRSVHAAVQGRGNGPGVPETGRGHAG